MDPCKRTHATTTHIGTYTRKHILIFCCLLVCLCLHVLPEWLSVNFPPDVVKPILHAEVNNIDGMSCFRLFHLLTLIFNSFHPMHGPRIEKIISMLMPTVLEFVRTWEKMPSGTEQCKE